MTDFSLLTALPHPGAGTALQPEGPPDLRFLQREKEPQVDLELPQHCGAFPTWASLHRNHWVILLDWTTEGQAETQMGDGTYCNQHQTLRSVQPSGDPMPRDQPAARSDQRAPWAVGPLPVTSWRALSAVQPLSGSTRAGNQVRRPT